MPISLRQLLLTVVCLFHLDSFYLAGRCSVNAETSVKVCVPSQGLINIVLVYQCACTQKVPSIIPANKVHLVAKEDILNQTLVSIRQVDILHIHGKQSKTNKTGSRNR